MTRKKASPKLREGDGCPVCNRPLTSEKALRRGMGEKCARKRKAQLEAAGGPVAEGQLAIADVQAEG